MISFPSLDQKEELVGQSKNRATENEPLNDARQKLVDIAVDRDHDCG
jgi:hypothetical protein